MSLSTPPGAATSMYGKTAAHERAQSYYTIVPYIIPYIIPVYYIHDGVIEATDETNTFGVVESAGHG